jgi:predicted chitinase/peptidoglycan hydrolase-like protein with peptidoglycan-binding domain
MALTPDVLERLGTPEDSARRFVPLLDLAMREFGITTPVRARMFLAQLAHESDRLTAFEERASGAKYEGNRMLGNTQPGDGVRFKGRGPIQLTGRWNYGHYGAMLGVDLISRPQLAAQPRYGFRLAAAYFEDRGCNRAADRGDFHECTRLINAAQLGYDQRFAFYQRLANVDPSPGAPYLKRGDHGDAVRTLTRRLSFVRSKATGKRYLDGKRKYFDAETEKALRAFQQEHGLTVDGRFGPRSARRLAKATQREKQRRKADGTPTTVQPPATSGGSPPVKQPAVDGDPARLPALVRRLEQREAEADRAWDAIVAHGRRRHTTLATLLGAGGAGGGGGSGRRHGGRGGDAEAAEFAALEAILRRIEAKLGTLVEIEQHEAAAGIAETVHAAEAVANGAPDATPAAAPSSLGGAAPTATATIHAATATAAAPAAAPPAKRKATDDELLERIEQLDRALDTTRRRIISRYATIDKELAKIAPPPVRRKKPKVEPQKVEPQKPKAPDKPDVRALQEELNRFTQRNLRNVTPLIVDGIQGPATRARIRKVKYWLGYSRADRRKLTARPELVKRLRKPRSARHSNPAMIARAIKRRRRQRALAKKSAAPRAGVVRFDGKDVAAWIEPHLQWARAHGWKGTIESGYRTPEYSEHICMGKCGRPSCPGNCAGRTSNHSGRIAPQGAVDVTDYPRFAALMRRSPHKPRLLNALPATDPNHFSATGH